MDHIKKADELRIGDRVTMKAFTDCFGERHERVTGLYVTAARKIKAAHGVAEYWRLTCIGREGLGWHEAAERFFDREAVTA